MVLNAAEKQLRRPRGANVNQKLKLDAPQREGFHRRFVINKPSRIMELEHMGYQIATERAGEGNARTDGLGTHIERHSGTNETGAPQGMILMETPIEEYRAGLKDKDDALKPFDEAIRSGRDTTGRMTETYKTGDTSSIS